MLNDLGAELSLIALKQDGFGPFQAQAHRGFTAREIQAIVRALSYPEVGFEAAGNGRTRNVQIRMTAPSHRSLCGVPLRLQHRVLGALVIGRKDIASFSDKDRRQIEGVAGELEAALAKAGLIASAMGEAGAYGESREPTLAGAWGTTIEHEIPALESLMSEIRTLIPFDRALISRYEPESKLLVGFLSHTSEHFEWRQGQTFTLDGSAAGWVIRHKKLRLDRDLASAQGRFLDYKELYKEKFKTALVLPLRRGQEVAGTIALASRTPDSYNTDMARAAAPLLDRLAKVLPLAGPRPESPAPAESLEQTGGESPADRDTALIGPDPFEARELLLRQGRQSAIRELTGFLEQEIQRTLTKTRFELEEMLGDPVVGETMPEGSLQRVEQAYRDLTRIETILNEIVDHAKPLELHPRMVRIPEILESALSVIADEIEQNKITVTRKFSQSLPPVRADEGKLQQVFLSILKNALEAMSTGGHIVLEAVPHRGLRGRHEVAITIQNDGAPIPTEHIGKIFEPGFTTKAAGTGLGLSSVKKIVEEHRGQMSIASGPGQGTTVIIRLPAHAAGRGRIVRGRRHPRRRHRA